MKRIIVKYRDGDCHAQIEDRPRIFGTGETSSEAIGDLVRNHPDEFGVEVVTATEDPA